MPDDKLCDIPTRNAIIEECAKKVEWALGADSEKGEFTAAAVRGLKTDG